MLAIAAPLQPSSACRPVGALALRRTGVRATTTVTAATFEGIACTLAAGPAAIAVLSRRQRRALRSRRCRRSQRRAAAGGAGFVLADPVVVGKLEKEVLLEQLPSLPETFVSPESPKEFGLYFSPDSSLGRTVGQDCQALGKQSAWYRPPWWLANGDLMTIYAATSRGEQLVSYKRHLVTTLDGGAVSLDVVEAAGGRPAHAMDGTRSTAMIISGLGGGSQDAYVKNLATAMVQSGMCVAVLNMRGCGRSPLLTPRFFSAYRGSTDDVRVAVQYMRKTLLGGGQRGIDAPVCLVGWSNGATVVTNTLAEQTSGIGKGHTGLWTNADAGAVLAAPYDMRRSTRHMEGEFFQRNVYNRRVAQSLVTQFEKHMHLFLDGPVPRWEDDVCDVDVDVEMLLQAQTIREIDDAITRKVFGYASTDDYYHDASCFRRLPHVEVPLLMVSAADDPMSTGWIPVEAVRNNSNLVLAYTEHGGHMGWLDEEDSQWAHWVEEAIVSFFIAALRHTGRAQ